MSGSHDKLPKIFWVQLVLAAFIGIMYLTNEPAAKQDGSAESTSKVEAAAANLAPVGAVSTASADAGSGTGRSGEEVYNGVCGTCHNTGIANAPKLDDKAAWEPRVANGLDGLITTASKGKGAMPPNGGDPKLTADELKATILYMTEKVGINLGTNKKPANENPAATTSTTEEPIKIADKKEVETVVIPPAAPAAPAAPTPPPTTEEAPVAEAPTSTGAVKTEEVASAETSPVNLEKGKKVYGSSCFACHDAGVAGSPKIGDKDVWTARIATGSNALYTSAISGKGIMPPKGGNMGISDDDVKAAVDYMVSMSR